MPRLQLYYPVTPHKVNRGWGVPDSLYAQFDFKTHNGVDLALVNGQEIYAPINASVINVGNEPKGGGIFVSLISNDQFSFDDGKVAYVLLDFFHCEKILVNVGDSVVVGQIIALGDNTGCTTGSHTHMQPRREILTSLPDGVTTNAYRIRNVNYGLDNLDINDANGSFDPEPYWNKKYAHEISPTIQLEEMIKTLTAKRDDLLKQRGKVQNS